MKFCPRCGAKNSSGEPVCGSCGQKLYGLLAGAVSQLACAFCATGNPPTAVYCLGCGRRLDETPTSVRAARRKAMADALAGVPPPPTAAATAGQPARTRQARQSTGHTLGCAAAVAVLVAAAGTAFVFRATIRPGGTPAPIEQDAAIATVSALIDRATPRSAFVGSAGAAAARPPRSADRAAGRVWIGRRRVAARYRAAGRDASSPPSSETRAAGTSAARTGEATTERSSGDRRQDDAMAGRPAGTATASGTVTGARAVERHSERIRRHRARVTTRERRTRVVPTGRQRPRVPPSERQQAMFGLDAGSQASSASRIAHGAAGRLSIRLDRHARGDEVAVAPVGTARATPARHASGDGRGGDPQRVDHLHAHPDRGRPGHAGARPSRPGADGRDRERGRRAAAVRSGRFPVGRWARHEAIKPLPAGGRRAGGRADPAGASDQRRRRLRRTGWPPRPYPDLRGDRARPEQSAAADRSEAPG